MTHYRLVTEPISGSEPYRRRMRRVEPPFGTPGLTGPEALDLLAERMRLRTIPAGHRTGIAAIRRRRTGVTT